MTNEKPAGKKSAADSFNDAWAKQWSDTSAERAKKQADGKSEYDAIIEKKRKADAENRY